MDECGSVEEELEEALEFEKRDMAKKEPRVDAEERNEMEEE